MLTYLHVQHFCYILPHYFSQINLIQIFLVWSLQKKQYRTDNETLEGEDFSHFSYRLRINSHSKTM